MRPLPLAALVLFVILGASGAPAADLVGRIRDAETGEPLGFVNVQARGFAADSSETGRGALGEADGSYRLQGLSNGRWKIRFSRVGYEPHEDSLDVGGNRLYTLEAALTPRPVQGKGILVEANRYADVQEVQTGFVTLAPEALQNLPGVVESDPIRTLELLPGVQAASDYSSGLYVRGGGPDQTLILLDQVPVYNPTHAFGFFSTFNPDALQDVNLYKGAYPARYGGRLGAVLDVRSRDGSRDSISGRASVSTIAARATVGGPLHGGAWIASLRRTYLEPLLALLRQSQEDVPDYSFYDGDLRLTVPVFGGRLTGSGYRGRDHLALEIDSDSDLDLSWGNTLGTLVWGRGLGARGWLRVQGYWSDYESRSSIRALTTPLAFSNHIRDGGLRTEASYSGERHLVTGGLMANHYDVRYDSKFNSQVQVDYHKTPDEYALFVEDDWRAWPGLVLQPGLRLGIIEGDRLLWEPRLAASQVVHPHLRVKVGGGWYHQYLQLVSTEALNATDFYVPLDPTMAPGRSWQAVTGLEYEPGPTWRTSVETYYTGLDDLVTLNNDLPAGALVKDAADVFYSGGSGWASGLELFAEKRRGRLTGWVGYGLGWTRRTFARSNAGEPFPPKYDRRHDLNVVAQSKHGKWTFGGNFVLASGQAFTPAAARYTLRNPATGELPSDSEILPGLRNSARLLPYHRLDLSVTRDFSLFGLPADWYIQIFNIYNRRNEWFVQYDTGASVTDASVIPMLPIIPSLGIDFQF